MGAIMWHTSKSDWADLRKKQLLRSVYNKDASSTLRNSCATDL